MLHSLLTAGAVIAAVSGSVTAVSASQPDEIQITEPPETAEFVHIVINSEQPDTDPEAFSEEILSEAAKTAETAANKPQRVFELTDREEYLLAKIAMAEAEGEDTEGKALVMLVILNRIQSSSFPDSVEEVIFQKHQFQPISDGRFDRVEPSADCWEALRMVQSGWDESCGATYFEASGKGWHSRNLDFLFKHGGHYFYKEF